MTPAEARRLAAGAARHGYFRVSQHPPEIYVRCPAGCGASVHSVFDVYTVPLEKRLRMTDRGRESAELRALRDRVREHLGEGCPRGVRPPAD